ncbi:hypothetical protein [Paenarthrobacter sp. C1]|uniref:hypothetical protein n=1 Tax=Paenarthrobacter sp. C1 TaxID=3400220 RepID=UPI003BF61B00
MDPTVSATNFFKALQKVSGWEQLDPTAAAHRVQRNADPYHYQSYWPAATEVVAALADVPTTGGQSSCGIPGTAGRDDDLPWRTAPLYQASPLGMFNRECTDFALWRINQQLGSAGAPYRVLNSTFRPDGDMLGSALTWKDAWDAKGWPTGDTPGSGRSSGTPPAQAEPTLPTATSASSRPSTATAATSKRATTATRPRTTTPTTPAPSRTAPPAPSCTCPAATTRRNHETDPDSPRGRARVHRLLGPGLQHHAPRADTQRFRRSAGDAQQRRPVPGPRRHSPAHPRHRLGRAEQDLRPRHGDQGHGPLRAPHRCRHGLDPGPGAAPHPQAAADYQYVDPADIPVRKITGPGRLKVDRANGFGCHVVFPTDAGDYDVQLLRAAAGKPWQVNRFTPRTAPSKARQAPIKDRTDHGNAGPRLPRIDAVLRADGTGEVTINGTSHAIQADDEAAVLSQALGLITDTAAQLGRPVKVSTTDPDGQGLIIVTPEGTVSEAPPAKAAPRRPQGPVPPKPAPAPVPDAPALEEELRHRPAAPATFGAAIARTQEPAPAAGAAAKPATRSSLKHTSFLVSAPLLQPATRGWRGALSRLGLKMSPSAEELAEREDVRTVSQHWPGPRTVAVVNRKGGANKTPPSSCSAPSSPATAAPRPSRGTTTNPRARSAGGPRRAATTTASWTSSTPPRHSSPQRPGRRDRPIRPPPDRGQVRRPPLR